MSIAKKTKHINGKVEPMGFYVAIRVTTAESHSESGIYLGGSQTAKEQAAMQTGEIVAFGPTSYIGWEGCKPDHTVDYPGTSGLPSSLWGCKVGDIVEFKPFEGMESSVDDTIRYIPDSHLVGRVTKAAKNG